MPSKGKRHAASDKALLESLAEAVEAAPSDAALRAHLAELLLESGDASGSLEHATAALALVPDSAPALAVAAQAAEAVGETERAQGYRRLHDALASASGGVVRENPAPESPPIEQADPSARDRGSVIRLHALPGERRAHGEDVESPSLTLDDVGGMEAVKQRLRVAFLAPLANPALRRMYAKSLRGGLLLWGPPGCGKTFIARATAGELGARFIAIGLHDVLDMFYGESEQRLHGLFEQARQSSPCVVFVDEVDALGRKRSQLRHSVGREVVVQFLSELDSMKSENEGVFVLAATNHPWDVDTALRRPGRLDRTVLVLPPDEEARKAILRYHLRERPVSHVDVDHIAERTDLFSGADLAHLCEAAAECAFADSVEAGTPRPIETGDLERALEEVKPSTLPWLQAARNYAEFAGEGGTYDELLSYLRAKQLA